jgi:hypothetical protein
MQNVVFGNDKVVLGHITKKLAFVVKCQDVEFYLFGVDADSVVGRWRRCALNAPALCKGARRKHGDGKEQFRNFQHKDYDAPVWGIVCRRVAQGDEH